jgi:hypothetical protein
MQKQLFCNGILLNFLLNDYGEGIVKLECRNESQTFYAGLLMCKYSYEIFGMQNHIVEY